MAVNDGGRRRPTTTSTTRPVTRTTRTTTRTAPAAGGLLGTLPVAAPPAEEEAAPRFSTADTRAARDHAIVTEWFKDSGVSSSVASDFANDLAQDFFNENGRWPTASELILSNETTNQMAWAAQGLYLLPGVFGVRSADGIDYFQNDPKQGLTQIDLSGERFRLTSTLRNVPIFSPDDIAGILGTNQMGGGGGGRGGGGGGGAGRAPAVFDRDQLIAEATELWRGRLLEEPDNVEAIVDEYVQKANSFWMGQGGQMDFGTFVLGKTEGTSRYKTLYAKRPESLSHEQYLAQYVQAVRGLGLRESVAMREIEAGASTGAGVAGFANRLETTPEVVAGNQGAFSQRFANHVAQLGVRGT